MRYPIRVLNEGVRENLTFSNKYPMMTCRNFLKDNISFKGAYWIRSNSSFFSIAPPLVIALPTLR